ncbi:glycosyltransferase family 25 protein [Pedobacter arcticus]|uniref:glycosyltransferase family 25 protein n=1 Tax=Pedobacter arcticus TaxID=752140 RepID=UPI0002D4498A|nr:glycosyltransferase family 25 protein [Pedobacter arcticus]
MALGKIEGIYIVHAKKGYEIHEERLIKIFKDLELNIEFVTDGDPSLFSDELLEKYFCSDIRSKLSPGILSCTLNHIFCYERIVKNKNRYAVVFENDPFFLGDFKDMVQKILSEAEELDKGFLISLENTTLEFPPYKALKRNQLLYPANKGRCAGAYIIDLKAAQDILDNLKLNKCCQVIDWWHNTLIDESVVKMYWAHPPVVEQGSHNGMMSSTISSKKKNQIRRLRWLFQKFYKTNIYPRIK